MLCFNREICVKASVVEVFTLLAIQARSQACVSEVAKFVLEESRGTKFKGLFHNLCYQNQTDNVQRKRVKNFLACHKNQGRTELSFQEIFPNLQR